MYAYPIFYRPKYDRKRDNNCSEKKTLYRFDQLLQCKNNKKVIKKPFNQKWKSQNSHIKLIAYVYLKVCSQIG